MREGEIVIGGKRFEYKGFTQNYDFVRGVCNRLGEVEINGLKYLKSDVVVTFDMLGEFPVWYFYVEV